ncbi:MAG: PHP domain-containing protein [Armatimonadetes bacterium]|nr:PHP domain-containing protein [Armatimonadota bacterium]
MRQHFVRLLAVLALPLLLAGAASSAGFVWARGNLHTHTTNSDGDSAPDVVVEWYKSNGYQFLVISDHWKVTDPAPLDKPGDDFVLIPGEETGVKGAPKPIHGNAIGVSRIVGGAQYAGSPAKSLSKMVQQIRAAGGVPQVNHPNFRWSFGYRELRGLKGPYLLEVYNGNPSVNNHGSEAVMSVEQVWDMLLSDGIEVYATATDDAHAFKEMAANKSNPGRGWICARVPTPSAENILDALRRGDFYASTGVELADCSFEGNTMRVQVAPKVGLKYWIRFVGKWGRILQESTGASAVYTAAGKREKNDYVRCKVIASDETVAWTQAYRPGR